MENTVLLTIDSLRADTESQGTTPHIDQLREDGLDFEDAIATGPRTTSSVPVFLTGSFYRFDESSMAARREAIRKHVLLNETLPERLSKQGYTTVAFSANPWITTDTGFDNVFDEFHEINPNVNTEFDVLAETPLVQLADKTLTATGLEDRVGWRSKREWFSHWSAFEEPMFETIDEISEPYFIWIFLMDTHQPTIVPREFRTETNLFKTYYALQRYTANRADQLSPRALRWCKEGYRDAVRSADEFVGRVREALPENDLLIVHSDHGEAFGEHGTNGHEYRFFEENVHVPLFAHHPDLAGSVTEQVSLQRLPDIVAQLATDPSSETNFSDSLVPIMSESYETANVRSGDVGYTPHRRALRGERFKYVETETSEKLYDRETDPAEQENVADEYPERVELFRKLLDTQSRRRQEQQRIVDAAGRVSL